MRGYLGGGVAAALARSRAVAGLRVGSFRTFGIHRKRRRVGSGKGGVRSGKTGNRQRQGPRHGGRAGGRGGRPAQPGRAAPDRFADMAKSEGYLARSVYKLKEIDRKNRVFKRGMRVIDLGAAPGSWTQFAAERVGPRGSVLAIDRVAPSRVLDAVPNVETAACDVFDLDIHAMGVSFRSFDVLLSDMAPQTTGVKSHDAEESAELCGRALDLAPGLVKPDGVVVLKIFQGPGFDSVLQRCRDTFAAVKCFKPESTRSESVETFIISREFKDIPCARVEQASTAE